MVTNNIARLINLFPGPRAHAPRQKTHNLLCCENTVDYPCMSRVHRQFNWSLRHRDILMATNNMARLINLFPGAGAHAPRQKTHSLLCSENTVDYPCMSRVHRQFNRSLRHRDILMVTNNIARLINLFPGPRAHAPRQKTHSLLCSENTVDYPCMSRVHRQFNRSLRHRDILMVANNITRFINLFPWARAHAPRQKTHSLLCCENTVDYPCMSRVHRQFNQSLSHMWIYRR